MNREEAAELLPVIEAFLGDKPIQSQYRNKIGAEWIDFGSGEYPSFHNSELKWRVKPEKQERWLNVYPKTSATVLYRDPVSASKARLQDCIACIRIEYEEGDGL